METNTLIEFTTRHLETNRRIRETDRYIGSPMQQLFDTRKSVQQSLDQSAETAHRAYSELAEKMVSPITWPCR